MSENKHQQGRTDHSAQSLSATEQQAANAAGANNNEQGQASFVAGSTTAGGSNFGQGSHQLGGESYRQGDTANSGANYSNETDKLGASSTGTSAEGASSATAGAAQSGRADELKSTIGNNARNTDNDASADKDRGQAESGQKVPEEGERRDTDLEQSSGLGSDDSSAARRESGSWSQSSTDQ